MGVHGEQMRRGVYPEGNNQRLLADLDCLRPSLCPLGKRRFFGGGAGRGVQAQGLEQDGLATLKLMEYGVLAPSLEKHVVALQNSLHGCYLPR